jgi:hypothetical protein
MNFLYTIMGLTIVLDGSNVHPISMIEISNRGKIDEYINSEASSNDSPGDRTTSSSHSKYHAKWKIRVENM